MALITAPYSIQMSSLTQTEENTLALTLAGLPEGSSTIWNSTLQSRRYWDGSVFVSMVDSAPAGFQIIEAMISFRV